MDMEYKARPSSNTGLLPGRVEHMQQDLPSSHQNCYGGSTTHIKHFPHPPLNIRHSLLPVLLL